MCRFVHSPMVSSIRLVRLRNALVTPLHDTASTRPDRVAVDDHINILGFQASEYDLLAGTSFSGVIMQYVAETSLLALSFFHNEGRAGCDVLRAKAALENQSTSNVPVQ